MASGRREKLLLELVICLGIFLREQSLSLQLNSRYSGRSVGRQAETTPKLDSTTVHIAESLDVPILSLGRGTFAMGTNNIHVISTIGSLKKMTNL